MSSNVVSTSRDGCLGAKSGEYVCLDCGVVLYSTNTWIKDSCKCGVSNCPHKPIRQCPICESKAKQPTAKLDIEELEKRKAEIKDRLK